MLSLLAAAVLLLGVWPDPLTSVMHASVDNLLPARHPVQAAKGSCRGERRNSEDRETP
ncbi:MAG: hypothetical protein MZV65_32165 [Chromatiales bacterium]|nr:hypothetical protein [Chromatiales bacterium]